MNHELHSIIERLRKEDSRWDAILELKMGMDPEWVLPLIELLKDPAWVVRWSVAEKLGDFQDERAIPPLMTLMLDKDYHVRKNALKALAKFESVLVPYIVPRFSDTDPLIRKYVFHLLIALGDSIIPDLFEQLEKHNWVVDQRIVHTISVIKSPLSDMYLIKALACENVKKNVILMLGHLNSQNAIPYLVQLYGVSNLKRIVFFSLRKINEDAVFAQLLRFISDESLGLSNQAGALILRWNDMALPHLVKGLLNQDLNRKRLCLLLDKIGPEPVKNQLVRLVHSNEDVRQELGKFLDKWGLLDS